MKPNWKKRKNFTLSDEAIDFLKRLADKEAAGNESYLIEKLIVRAAKAKKLTQERAS